jgi:hypothetical protein
MSSVRNVTGFSVCTEKRKVEGYQMEGFYKMKMNQAVKIRIKPSQKPKTLYRDALKKWMLSFVNKKIKMKS